MANAENKLQKIGGSVDDFLNSVTDMQQKTDAKTLRKLMEKLTGKKAELWSYGIVGCGNYHYKYDSGREGAAGVVGFSPRKENIVLYIVNGYDDYGPLLDKLGKHKIGKSCLYIKRLSDIDMSVLQELMRRSINYMKEHYVTDLA